MNVSIRDALKGDVETIAEFNLLLADETESAPLSMGIVAAGVLAILEDPSKGRYWVAELDGRIVGQIGEVVLAVEVEEVGAVLAG